MAGNTWTKIFVIMNEKNSFWIITENGKIIRKNPTKEEMKMARLVSYSDTNVCPICRQEYERGDISELADKCILYPRNVDHETDKNGKKIGGWICRKHGRKSYQRYSPNSQNNVLRSVADIRTGNLIDYTKLLCNSCEELTEKWLGAERLSIKYDRYSRIPLDHGPITKHISILIGCELIDLYGKVPQTKGKCYSPKYGWSGGSEKGENFDVLILYCLSVDGKKIERIYIFPKDSAKRSIGIILNPTDSHGNRKISIYDNYRVTDEEEIIRVNNIYRNIILNDLKN